MTIVVLGSTVEVLAIASSPVLTSSAAARRDRLMKSSDRDDFLAARALSVLALIEAGLHSVQEDEIQQRCEQCGSDDHGRPSVRGSDVALSWAHSDGWVIVGVAEDPIGVDIERRRAGILDSGPIGLAESERQGLQRHREPDVAYLRAWTMKESLIKVGEASLDTVTGLTLLGTDGEFRTEWAGFTLSSLTIDSAVGGAASRTPARWLGLADLGALSE